MISPQQILDSLKRERPTDIWLNATNNWVRLLSSGGIGRLTEDLVAIILGGIKTQNSLVGYDIDVSDKKIEVKAATVSISNRYPLLSWKGIRPNDPYTHICFVAIYPEDTRIFLVPKDDIPTKSLSPMNVPRKGMQVNYQIHIRKINNLPEWLINYEI